MLDSDDLAFRKKRKVRYLVPEPDQKFDWDGPLVSRLTWCHWLKSCDWFEIQASTLDECIRDDVLPCVDGEVDLLRECERRKWPVCFLPNTVFFDSSNRWRDAAYFQSPWTYSILLLNDEDRNAAWQLTNQSFRGAISRVRHFLRPSIFTHRMYAGPFRWDVLLYLKSRDFQMQNVAARWPNYTMIQNGYYTYEELRYKAQRSRFCIIGSCWDSYGVAAQEIMAEGCPALVCDPGTLPGNCLTGQQAIYLQNRPQPTLMGSDADELERAAREVLSWDRRQVREATLRFADPNVLREQWRQAIYGEGGDDRRKAIPSAQVYCFAKCRYVPRFEAKCIQQDIAHGFPHT